MNRINVHILEDQRYFAPIACHLLEPDFETQTLRFPFFFLKWVRGSGSAFSDAVFVFPINWELAVQKLTDFIIPL
jgi:hypothetical protein